MGKKSKRGRPKAPKVAHPATKGKWIPRSETTTVNSLNVLDTMCKHGLDTSEVTFESEGAIFTKTFLEREDYQTICVGEWMLDNFDEHIGVWNNDKNRQSAIDTLVTFGTDLIIGANGESYSLNLEMAKESALAIQILEDHDGKCTDLTLTSLTPDNSSKAKNLCSDREIIRFYKKRINCGCLEDKYKQIKKDIPNRLRFCDNCEKFVERSTLMACASCKLTLYCSKTCQTQHWKKSHKEECSKIVATKKEVKLEKSFANFKESIETGNKDAAKAAVLEMANNLPNEVANMTLGELFSKRG